MPHEADDPEPQSERPLRVGIDTGGTFTDLVAIGAGPAVALKVPSTPDRPEQAVLEALAELDRRHPALRGRPRRVVHGSTVATNTMLEGAGARVCLVTNEGFEDLVEIGRQARAELYALEPSRAEPMVARDDRLGLRQRSLVDGSVLERPSAADYEALRDALRRRAPDAIAIGLLHAYADPAAEKEVEAELEVLGLPVCRSSDVAPLFREFERLSTTVANASLLPVVQTSLDRLQACMGDEELCIQQSNGGLTSPAHAGRYPVRMVLSGPSGGVHAAERALRRAGIPAAISFDMGGTSTDVGWIQGEARRTSQIEVGGHPLMIEAMEVHTIGAGGGSLVWQDDAGALRVGPRSAGANPGPACYGRGERATVTDGHVVLGRLPASRRLGDCISVDADRSRAALQRLAQPLGVSVAHLAHRVLDIADAAMAKAIQHISLQRGHDPRDHALFAFGGAGGLHANRLAASIGMPRVIVPPNPGALSAFGMAVADARFDRSRAWLQELPQVRPEDDLAPRVRALEGEAREALRAELGPGEEAVETLVACRYLGQSFELRIAAGPQLRERFEAAHELSYGFRLDRPLQCVSLHSTAVRREPDDEPIPPPPRARRARPRATIAFEAPTGPEGEGSPRPVPHFDREELAPGDGADGPCVVSESTGTTVVEEGWGFSVAADGSLVLEPLSAGD